MKRTRTLALLTSAVTIFALAISLTVNANAVAPKTAAPKLKLLWSQEFNHQKRTYPDQKVWNFDLGTGENFWGNGEYEFYTDTAGITHGICPTGMKIKATDQRICLDSKKKSHPATGVLNIRATKVDPDSLEASACYSPTNCFFSTRINTQGKLSFKYGKIEARIWMPKGDGTWPAFWLLGNNITSKPWPACGEIDIVEVGTDHTLAQGTAHGPVTSFMGMSNGGVVSDLPLDNGWHTFGLIWTKTMLQWTLDGKPYYTLTSSSGQSSGGADTVGSHGEKWAGLFDQPYFLILNLAMGGAFVQGAPDPALKATSMKVDWIRYSSYNGLGTLYKK